MGILWRKIGLIGRVFRICCTVIIALYWGQPSLTHSFICAKHFNGKNSASHILCQRWFLKYLWGGVLSRKTCLLISTPESHLYSCKKCLIDSAEFLERKHLSSLRLLFVAMSFFCQIALLLQSFKMWCNAFGFYHIPMTSRLPWISLLPFMIEVQKKIAPLPQTSLFI